MTCSGSELILAHFSLYISQLKCHLTYGYTENICSAMVTGRCNVFGSAVLDIDWRDLENLSIN